METEMIDPTKMRPAAEPHRTMTDAERQYFAENLLKTDLPPAITATTRGGGNLTLMLDGELIQLKAEAASGTMYMMRWFRPQFHDLMEGGLQHLPGVGRLVATPRGRDRIRLVLVPARKGGKDFRGGGFEADLRLSEITTKL